MTLDFDKLGKLLALAGSDYDGEAVAAVRKANAMLRASGLSFTDVAERLRQPTPAGRFSTFDDLADNIAEEVVRAYQKTQERRKPKGYTKGGITWASKAAYDAFCAQEAARREAERRRHAPQRAAVLAKYGSETAAIARDEREQVLHDAALPWLEGPFAPQPGHEHLAGRWHDSMGGWSRYDFDKHPVDECRQAIETAFPIPTAIRGAQDELRYWDERNDELCHALELWGDEQLDLPASYRRDRVRRLYETELPIVTLDDLHLRLSLAAHADWKDVADELAEPNLEAFERLILGRGVQTGHPRTATERRDEVLALLSNVDTADLSDREIARRVGCSPQTVGNIRRWQGAR